MVINQILKLFLVCNFLISFQLFGNAEEKSRELCECLNKAKISNTAKDKKECLLLREKHVKALKKGSDAYSQYTERLGQCEREMVGNGETKSNLSLEEKVKEVCDCFSSAEKGQKMACFQKQSQYGKTIADDQKRIEFNQATNGCDK